MKLSSYAKTSCTAMIFLAMIAPSASFAQSAQLNPLLDQNTECGKTFSELAGTVAGVLAEQFKGDPAAFEKYLKQYMDTIKPRLTAEKKKRDRQSASITSAYQKKIDATNDEAQKSKLKAERDAKLHALAARYAQTIQNFLLSINKSALRHAALAHEKIILKQLASEYAAAFHSIPPRDSASRKRVKTEYAESVKNTKSLTSTQIQSGYLSLEQTKYAEALPAYFCGNGLPIMEEESAFLKTIMQQKDAYQKQVAELKTKKDSVGLFELDAAWSKTQLDASMKMKSLTSKFVQGLKQAK